MTRDLNDQDQRKSDDDDADDAVVDDGSPPVDGAEKTMDTDAGSGVALEDAIEKGGVHHTFALGRLDDIRRLRCDTVAHC